MSSLVDKYILARYNNTKEVKIEDKGTYIGNYMCHNNSLSYAIKNKRTSNIVAGLQIFNGGGIVAHFIVKMKDGTYIDPTYGNLSSTLYSKFIPLYEYDIKGFEPGQALIDLKKELFEVLPWWLRIFASIDQR